MGAWIEITNLAAYRQPQGVAPSMGAWIEIYASGGTLTLGGVAPSMGAWIEIIIRISNMSFTLSRSLYGSVD